MIFLLLISCPVVCNASFTKTSRSLILVIDDVDGGLDMLVTGFHCGH